MQIVLKSPINEILLLQNKVLVHNFEQDSLGCMIIKYLFNLFQYLLQNLIKFCIKKEKKIWYQMRFQQQQANMLIKNLLALSRFPSTLKFHFARSNQLKKDFCLRLQATFGTPLKDYQYSKLINDDINANDAVSAYNLILQSHFNNVTLDSHTFCRMFLLMQAQMWKGSYSIVLYEIYKTSFKPNLTLFPLIMSLQSEEGMSQQMKLDINLIKQKLMESLSMLHKPGRKTSATKRLLGDDFGQNEVRLKRVKINYQDSKSENAKSMTLNELIEKIKTELPKSVVLGEIKFKRPK